MRCGSPMAGQSLLLFVGIHLHLPQPPKDTTHPQSPQSFVVPTKRMISTFQRPSTNCLNTESRPHIYTYIVPVSLFLFFLTKICLHAIIIIHQYFLKYYNSDVKIILSLLMTFPRQILLLTLPIYRDFNL